MTTTLTRRDVWHLLRNERGRPLQALSWTFEAFECLDDPDVRELLLWAPRQSGKSQWLYASAASELLCVPGSYTLIVGASADQTESVFGRKLRRPLERLAADAGLADELRFTRNSVELPSLGSAIELIATNAATAPARTVSLLLVDEARDVPDRLYQVVAPSVIGAGGKIVAASTAGPPRGWFYNLLQHPTAETRIIHPTRNENPEAKSSVLSFLQRRLSAIAPQAARRELDNEFVDDGASLIPWPVIEAAIDDRVLADRATGPCWAGVDLSLRKDLTSIVVVERARRADGRDALAVRSIEIFDPKDSPSREVDFDAVRHALARLPDRFPSLKAVLVDAGAESSSILPWARQHPRLSLLVSPFTATAESNMAIWSSLSARLHARSVTMPRHERLLAELRGLRAESFAFGSKWRVVDSSRRFHRDVSFSLALAIHAAAQTRTCASPLCDDPACDGEAPLSLLFSADATEFDRKHPRVDARPPATPRNEQAEERQARERHAKWLEDRAHGVGWFPGD